MEKVTHPESISETFYTLGILIDQIATSQLAISYIATIKIQMTGVYMIQKNTQKNETYMETSPYLVVHS